MGITFSVDDVEPANAPLPVPREPLLDRIGGAVIARSPEVWPLVESSDQNGLVATIHRAHAEHRPLLLTPDAIWLTLAQGFAIHVTENAEALRHRFVRHDGRKTLFAEGADWQSSFDAFAAALGEELGPGLVNLITCSFSTTTPVERVASQVVLMDTFQKYFDYDLYGVLRLSPHHARRHRRRLGGHSSPHRRARRVRPRVVGSVPAAARRPVGRHRARQPRPDFLERPLQDEGRLRGEARQRLGAEAVPVPRRGQRAPTLTIRRRTHQRLPRWPLSRADSVPRGRRRTSAHRYRGHRRRRSVADGPRAATRDGVGDS
ncbi:MAG: DUF4419 domain-containing protein [Myxococcaceae bacterium]|nr:DUF4419 domain-containing protein [Myxococcaceae bacterium]